jgi:hypothetical protein
LDADRMAGPSPLSVPGVAANVPTGLNLPLSATIELLAIDAHGPVGAELSWTRKADEYRVELRETKAGAVISSSVSTGRIRGDRLVPARYERRLGDVAVEWVEFDHAAGVVRASGGGPPRAVAEGAQDALSVLFQLALHAQSIELERQMGPSRTISDSVLRIAVVSTSGVEVYEFTLVADNAMHSSAGWSVPAFVFAGVNADGARRTIEISRYGGYLPLSVDLGGSATSLDFRLTDLKVRPGDPGGE